MLKSWLIQNFKPILDSGNLPLAPVTVLAGRNSSGKSSLIQSILMIAQTLSNRILDRALLPNGPIIQLGTFEDILSEQTGLRTLVVGFELEMEQEGSQEQTGPRIRYTKNRLIESDAFVKSVKIFSQFRSGSTNGTSASALEASKVDVDSVTLELGFSHKKLSHNRNTLSSINKNPTELNFYVDIKRLSFEDLENFLKDVSPEYLRLTPYTNGSNYMGYLALKDTTSEDHLLDSSLVTFSHFLPRRLVRKYNIEERRRTQLVNILELELELSPSILKSLESHTSTLVKLSEYQDIYTTFSHTSSQIISDLCTEQSISPPFSGHTFDELVEWYRSLKQSKSKKFLGVKLREAIAQVILEQTPSPQKDSQALETINNNRYVQYLEEAVEQTIQFFASKIRYLGPLRADPQAVQKFAPSSELDDVGAKGEYAAAVYDANQNASIQWYNPFTEQTKRGKLQEALDTWVRYLGVADEVKIQMAGQSGVSWQVIPIQGQKARPLTAVGVGVSQILPILVMGLLAPNNTLLLVEQPELHLHPTVQARLGDFFMGLAKCDKQCIIETHSENLVSQLRYHIVQADGQENSDCLIYFVDQDERGAARFNPIEISAQGNILNWPDGFFDETMLQEDRITGASMKKRAKK